MTPPAPTAAVITGGAKAKLAADVFALPRNDALVHQVVTAELAARRQGTHSTKTRGLVAGGRAKPWRQKGTGRARQGTIRAPQWTGGGVVFGPHPRNYTGKVNKKARGKALSIALSAHADRRHARRRRCRDLRGAEDEEGRRARRRARPQRRRSWS